MGAEPPGIGDAEVLLYDGINLTRIQSAQFEIFNGLIQHGREDLFCDFSFFWHDISLQKAASYHLMQKIH